MLEVLPIQTKLEQEAICARCGVEFKVDCMAYHALVDGNLTAVCQFTMDEDGGHIHDLAMVRDVEFTDRDRIGQGKTWSIDFWWADGFPPDVPSVDIVYSN